MICPSSGRSRVPGAHSGRAPPVGERGDFVEIPRVVEVGIRVARDLERDPGQVGAGIGSQQTAELGTVIKRSTHGGPLADLTKTSLNLRSDPPARQRQYADGRPGIAPRRHFPSASGGGRTGRTMTLASRNLRSARLLQ